jgi:alpha-1,2-mannosyltransferase
VGGPHPPSDAKVSGVEVAPERESIGLGAASRRAGALLACAVLPAALWFVVLRLVVQGGRLYDFRIFRHAGAAVLHGLSPWQVQGFRYPAPAAIIFAPFAALPYPVAASIFLFLMAAAAMLTLYALDVRDWRCYGLAALSLPVAAAMINGTISTVIALLAALAWRYRDRPGRCAFALAAAICLKLWLWPLLVWLLASRRTRAAALTAAYSLAAAAASWALIGYGTVGEFVRVLTKADLGSNTYSLYALARELGLAINPARAVVATAGSLLLVAACRSRNERGYALALGACLILTPFLFTHYLALCFVPIALARPRLAPLWGAPLILWLTALAPGSGGSGARAAAAFASVVFILAAAYSVQPQGRIGRRWSLERPSR